MSYKEKLSKRLQEPKSVNIAFIVSLSLLLAIGAASIFFTWKQGMDRTKKNAYRLSATVGASLQKSALLQLSGESTDLAKVEYKQLKSSLLLLASLNDSVKYAYVYTEKNERIRSIADSEMPDSPRYAPPGETLAGASEDYLLPFIDREPHIVKSPENGGEVCVLRPLTDTHSKRVFAVIGVNYSARVWNGYAHMRVSHACIIVFCLLIVLTAFYRFLCKNVALKAETNKLCAVNEKLSEKEELFRTIFEQSPVGILIGTSEKQILDVNPMYERIAGRSKEEIRSLGWREITHPDDIQKDAAEYERFKAGEINGYSLIKRYLRPDQSIVWVNLTIAHLNIGSQPDYRYIGLIENITDRVNAEQELRESERSKAVLLSNLPGMAYRCSYDRSWTMQFVSQGCFELTGYKPESLLFNREVRFDDLVSPEYREPLWEKWTRALEKKEVFRDEFYLVTARGDRKWVFEQGVGIYGENGEVLALEGIIIDITDQKMREEEIRYITYHDVLTGLYNRRFFDDAKKRLDCEEALPLSIIIGDIDGLKLLNDALGHNEGDKLITSVSKILSRCIRESDVLARTGGDEFSILLPKTSSEEADGIIKQIRLLCEEFKKSSAEDTYHTSISMGYATKAYGYQRLESLIKEAEDYMYRHKLLQNKRVHTSIISSMKTTMYEKSQETEEHAQRLIKLSNRIGQKMNLTEEQLYELELLSTLHDIGKIGVNDNILNKPGVLTQDEWIEMKKHPEIGYRIAMSSQEIAPIAEYILCHHERWDGYGYPQGMRGEEIPLMSRILAVVDAYDAMTSDRPYRKALPLETALAELENNAGSQFDPRVVRVFLEMNQAFV